MAFVVDDRQILAADNFRATTGRHSIWFTVVQPFIGNTNF